MTDKNYHHGDLRSALVEGARTILERDGLSALSLRACAREVGVSHAAPLHHFKNLAELLAAVAASGFQDFVSELDIKSKDASDPLQRLFEMGIAYAFFAAKNPALYRVMFGAEVPNVQSADLREAMRAAWTQLYCTVCEGVIEKHALSSATLVWSFAHGHSMLVAAQCLPPVISNPDQNYRDSLTALITAIRFQQ